MTTLDLTVAASADDANETSAGDVQITQTQFNTDQTGEWQAARFVIPNPTTGLKAGATITAAYLTMNFNDANQDEPDIVIYGEDTATPGVYVTGTGTFTISARTRTTASVDWSNANLGAPGDFNSPSLVSIIQELVDSYDYSGGGYMALMTTSKNGTATRDAQTQLYDGSTTLCWRLHIEFTPASSGSTITMDTLTLAGSVPNLAVAATVSVAMNTLTLAGSVPTMTVVSGSVAVLLDVLTLAGSVPNLAVSAQVTVALNTLALAGSVPDLTVTPGAVAIALDTLNLAGSVPDLSITIGVFISMNTLTLAGSVPDLSVAPGAVAVLLDALSLAGSVPDLSVTPGAIAIALDTLNLAASVPNLTVYATVTIALDTLSLAGSVPDLTVTPGAVAIALDTLTLLASAETLSIPGGAIVDYLIRVGLVSRTAGQKPAQLVGRREPRTKGNDNPA